MARSLYICYFGLREPLVETQVLPYLRELIKGGNEIELLTFEPEFKRKWTATEVDEARIRLAAEGIRWHALGYHKRPSEVATAYDILRGAIEVRRIASSGSIDILHARVHVPALMAAIARKFSRKRPKLLFDIRGFVPEEYTDAGVWPDGGVLYRMTKRIERWLMRESDGFVVLTEAARRELFPESRDSGRDRFGRPVEVIPCCVDLAGRFPADVDAFRAEMRQKLSLDGRFVVAHIGALGGLYMTESIADLLAVARERDPSTLAMFLTQSDPGEIEAMLAERGFGPEDRFIARVPSADVPGYLCAADVGVSLVKATYATMSRSPTKIPEYLACGLPVIANRGVGDVDALIEGDNVGVLLASVDRPSIERGMEALTAMFADRARLRSRCVSAGSNFDLSAVAGERYRRIYRDLTSGK
jgi:glycosyltransferase involved in cell wall biosynthesis